MFEFLRGRKRKLGCVTLVLACLLTAGWVRSLSWRDFVATGLFGEANTTLASISGRIYLYSLNPLPLPRTSLHSSKLNPDLDPWKSMVSASQTQFADFGFAKGHHNRLPERIEYRIWMIPYWSIVIPLTLMSAWLLLSKPRAKIEPLTTENGKP